MTNVGEGFTELDERIEYFIKGAAIQNFGDYLPEIFCQDLLTYPKIDADLFRLVGSVIDDRWVRQDLKRVNGYVTGLIAFWCCGSRSTTPLSADTLTHCRFFGVRGPLTRRVLGLPDDTVLGDPGLLAPLFHTPRADPTTSGKTICIPHVHDLRPRADILAMSGADLLIHPEIAGTEAALREILDQIASADFVLSASLHGAIIACAYGTPFAFWDNGHLDVPFKWDDFSGSIGLETRFARSLEEGRALHAEMIKTMRLPPLAPILEVAPFAVRPAALLRALAHDGAGDAAALTIVADLLDRDAPRERATLHRLQSDSAANRRSRARLTSAAKGRLGVAARRLKKRVRAAIGLT